jgi:hypothetical protein
MRTLQEKFNAILEGNFSKAQFRRDAAMELPQFISNVNSFDDTVSILKNKGILSEAKKEEPQYSTASPADHIAPDVIDTGIKFELDAKHGTLDVSTEEYEKIRKKVIKNLSKDVLYYVKKDSVQLETPKDEMTKAKKINESAEEDEYYDNLAKDREGRHDAAQSEYEKIDSDLAEEEATEKPLKSRIAKLTNELLAEKGSEPAVKAFAIQVKNDIESGDPSRVTKYERVLTRDDLEKIMQEDLMEETVNESPEKDLHQIHKFLKEKLDKVAVESGDRMSHFSAEYPLATTFAKDVKRMLDGPVNENDYAQQSKEEGLEELRGLLESLEELTKEAHEIFRIFFPSYLKKAQAYGALDFGVSSNPHDTTLASIIDEIEQDGDSLSEGDWEDKGQSRELNKKRLADLKAKRAKGGPKGALAVMDKQIADLEKLVSEAEPDVEDLYQHDDEYLATLQQKRALKEMFKKIITKVIND